jgi:hypothetical protein
MDDRWRKTDAKWWQKLTLPLARWATKKSVKTTSAWPCMMICWSLYTIKPVYSGHLGEIDKMTTIYRWPLRQVWLYLVSLLKEAKWGPMWSWSHGSWIYNYLEMQSVPITTYIARLNPTHGRVFSIHYMINFVSDLRKSETKYSQTCLNGHLCIMVTCS